MTKSWWFILYSQISNYQAKAECMGPRHCHLQVQVNSRMPLFWVEGPELSGVTAQLEGSQKMILLRS